MKTYQIIASCVILVILIAFAAVNLCCSGSAILEDAAELDPVENWSALKDHTAALDEILRERLVGRWTWSWLYGNAVRNLGKREINMFSQVMDRDRVLHQGNFWNTTDIEMKDAAQRIRRMQDHYSREPEDAVPGSGSQIAVLGERTAKVIVLLFPSKYNPEWTKGYYGIPYQDMNPIADDLLRYLRRYNVDYIDYRELLLGEGKQETDIFYRGDPYWNTETAFWASGKLLEHFRLVWDDDWDPEGFYADIRNYAVERYDLWFYGEQGLDSGSGFTDADGYTLITPDFHTDVQSSFQLLSGSVQEESGSLRQVLITERYLSEDDPHERDLHRTYLSGRYTTGQIINLEAEPEDPAVLFIWDGYSPEIPVFLTPMTSRIDLIDVLNLQEGTRIDDQLTEDYDYIIFGLSVDHMSSRMFPFCIETAAPEGKEPGEEEP